MFKIDYSRWHLFVGVVCVAAGFAHLIRKFNRWDDSTAFAIALAVIGLSFLAGYSTRREVLKRKYFYWSLLPLLFYGFWYFFRVEFGSFSWSAMAIHYKMGVNNGVSPWVMVKEATQTIAGISAVLIGVWILVWRDSVSRTADKFLAVGLIAANPAVYLVAQEYMTEKTETATLQNAYQEPEVLAAPAKYKNLVHVFLESAERTMFDRELFGTSMEPLLDVEKRGLAARQMKQITNTHYSMAGIVSATCGIPLLSNGFTSNKSLAKGNTFLPGAECLGDLLSEANYKQYFVYGTRKTFAGNDKYFSSRGYQHLHDVEVLKPLFPGSEGAWGVHDDAIFKHTLNLMRENKKNGYDGPINYTLKMTGGHRPSGYVANDCLSMQTVMQEKNSMLRAIKCTNVLLEDFLQKAEKEDLLKDTLVVVQSDHLMMASDITDDLDKRDRNNFFAMFGPGIEPKVNNAPSSTMDIFPTIMAGLGFKIKNDHAALGVDLNSDKKTVLEELGLERMNAAIVQDETLRLKVWGAEKGVENDAYRAAEAR